MIRWCQQITGCCPPAWFDLDRPVLPDYRSPMNSSLLVALSAFAAGALPCFGAITIVGGSGAGGAPAYMGVSHDIVLTISDGVAPFQGALYLVLDEWVTPVNQAPGWGQFNQGMNTYLSGEAAYSGAVFMNAWGINQGSVSLHDGVLSFFFPTVWRPRETFTIKAGLYQMQTSGGFESLSGTAFSGNVFLTNNSFERVSQVQAIPVAGTATLGALGLSFVCARRRR